MKFCLIGEKLGHSYSEKIHRLKGLDYCLKEVPANRLSDFLSAPDFDGFNVTFPYKKTVMGALSEVSETALAVGAVNTVKNAGGRLFGYNTDFGGLKYMLERKNIALRGKIAAVLGTGGAAATAVALLKSMGAKAVYSVSRKGEINYENYGSAKDAEIIINATPVGMYPNAGECLVDFGKFRNLSAVADCVYNPDRTELIMRAEEAGLSYTGGLPMLVEQALLAEDIWLGKTHTAEETEEMISAIKRQTLNIVLTGMPSCGKTTLGRLVAEKTGRKFFDADEFITEKFGETPAEIILRTGEKAFREKEREAIKELSALTGAVIATGGGSVCIPENVRNLKSNGVIIYVKRDLNSLTAQDRPISEKEGIKALYERRRGIYESTADGSADNAENLDVTVKEIIKEYETACNQRG